MSVPVAARGRRAGVGSEPVSCALPARDDDMEPVWRALANPARRAMLDLLRDGPRTTGAIAAQFPALSRFAVMQHLGVLTTAELVVARREGRERYNYLNPLPIQRLYDRWVVRYTKPWMEALLSMRDQLESQERVQPRGQR